MKECIFKEIIQPILPAIEEEAHKIKADSDMYTLSFFPFTINLLFSIIEGIKSIGTLSLSSHGNKNFERNDLRY